VDHTRAFFDRLIAWSPVPAARRAGRAHVLARRAGAAAGCATRRVDAARPGPVPRRLPRSELDENGKPREALSAKRGDHFPDDESVDLTQPMFRSRNRANRRSR